MKPANTTRQPAPGANPQADIRRQMRKRRRDIDQITARHNSLKLCQKLTADKTYRTANTVAAYLANDGEIDPDCIIEHAWNMDKQVYLPILAPLQDSLYFAPYLPGRPLRLNRFNIPEPVCRPAEWKRAWQLDLLLLPLVAFDADANRIGMGGGFYDRTLAYLRHRRHWRKPTLVGVAHECQRVASIAPAAWDIPLDRVISELAVYP